MIIGSHYDYYLCTDHGIRYEVTFRFECTEMDEYGQAVILEHQIGQPGHFEWGPMPIHLTEEFVNCRKREIELAVRKTISRFLHQ